MRAADAVLLRLHEMVEAEADPAVAADADSRDASFTFAHSKQFIARLLQDVIADRR